jgi:tetratricopeptide (TPR) repeat protein
VYRLRLVLLAGPFLMFAVAAAAQDQAAARRAPLFDNLGKYHHKITTGSESAQKYFDQGLTLVYGFNHHEAIRSFKEAARLDPDCAMAWWGIALAYGLNINAPMMEEVVPRAYEALQEAQKLAPKVSEKEQAYIRALAKRYTAEPVKDRLPLEKAYADAMREVATRYPDDLDAATLFAEATMNTMPWNYWSKEGTPQPGTEDAIAALESVLRRNPVHPGANHYYIHAVEASPHPERGLAAAYRLGHLCPGAGHLVHMPSHIFLRLGFYHDAVTANERAVAADETYIASCKVQGFYPAMYYSHNVHFLWYALTLEGRSDESIREGKKAAAMLKDEKGSPEMPQIYWLRTTTVLALARFGRWQDVLREPLPAPDLLYERAISHYARGLAFARLRKLPDAEAELAELTKVLSHKDAPALESDYLPGLSLMRLAHLLLTAEVEGGRGSSDARIKRLEEAVKLQDELPYMEPPYWYYSVRQSLGAALLDAGQSAKAETVYRADLKHWPKNGWSLFGLLQSLRQQGKTEDAADIQRQFRDAWKYADVTLTASSF